MKVMPSDWNNIKKRNKIVKELTQISDQITVIQDINFINVCQSLLKTNQLKERKIYKFFFITLFCLAQKKKETERN